MTYFKTEIQEISALEMREMLPVIDKPGIEKIYMQRWHEAQGDGFDRVEAYLMFHGAEIDSDIPEAEIEALFKECEAYEWLALDKKEARGKEHIAVKVLRLREDFLNAYEFYNTCASDKLAAEAAVDIAWLQYSTAKERERGFKMKIEFMFYNGVAVNFETDTDLPNFEYGCTVRTKLMHKQLEEKKFSMLWHKISDFIVEGIEITADGERWLWGS